MSGVDAVEPEVPAVDTVEPAAPAASPAEPSETSPAAEEETSAPPLVGGVLRRGWRHGRHVPRRYRKAAMACGVALFLALAVAVPSTVFLRKAHRMHRRALRDVLMLQSSSKSGGALADSVLLARASAMEMDGDEYVLRVPKAVVDVVKAADGNGRAKKKFAKKIASAIVDGHWDVESVTRMLGTDAGAAESFGGRGWGRGRHGRRGCRGRGRRGRRHGRGRGRGRRGRGGRGRRRRGRGRREWTDMFWTGGDDVDGDGSDSAFEDPGADEGAVAADAEDSAEVAENPPIKEEL